MTTQEHIPVRKRKILANVIVIIFLFMIAAWSFKSQIKNAYYGYKAKSEMTSQTKKLSSALGTIGITPSNKITTKCINELVYGYKQTQYQCIAESQNYVVIGSSAETKARFVAKAKELDTLLKSEGWVTTSNSATSLSEWFQLIATGKDYTTDIDSVRNKDNTHCSLVFNVAYSNPGPPAIQIRMSCSTPVLDKLKDLATF